jgi:glycosyltransferase involved in cell wall biosynthesis
MATLSVVVLTLNEERNIDACLASVRWADEIIVVDSGSADRTVEIARRHTESVLSLPWEGYGATKNSAMRSVTSEWVLWLDADERVTPDLQAEITATLGRNDPAVAACSMPRRAYFLGRWIRHSGWYPGRVTRLFRKSKGKFSESRVHEQLVVDGATLPLRGDILHYTDPDLDHYFRKFNRYTTLAAEDMAQAGRRSGVADLLIRPPFQFVKMYIMRAGILDGMQGFILAVVSSAYVFVKYAKLWEMRRGRTRDNLM